MLYLMQNIDELRIVFLMVNFKYLKKFWLAGGEIDLGNSRSLMTFGCDMSVKMALYRLKFEYILHIGIIKRCDVCVHITAIFFYTPHKVLGRGYNGIILSVHRHFSFRDFRWGYIFTQILWKCLTSCIFRLIYSI